MRCIFKALISATTKNRVGLWCWDHTVVRAARFAELHMPFSAALLAYGHLFDRFAGYTRLPKSQFCLNLGLVNAYRNLSGCVVECGVWRGGMSAGMAALLGNQRDYYLFDSFEGLPPAATIDGEKAIEWQAANQVDNCRTDDAYAHEAMQLADAKRFHVVGGWFDQSLPDFRPPERIAILRLDADWYSSTTECLKHLYDQVVPGGLIIVDDYYAWDGCARAVHDYLATNLLRDRIRQHRDTVCYLVKSEESLARSLEPVPSRDGDLIDPVSPPGSPVVRPISERRRDQHSLKTPAKGARRASQ